MSLAFFIPTTRPAGDEWLWRGSGQAGNRGGCGVSDFNFFCVFFKVPQQREGLHDAEIAEGLDTADLHVHVRMVQQIRQEVDNLVVLSLHEFPDRPSGGHRFIQRMGLLHAVYTFWNPVRVVGYSWSSIVSNFGAQLFQEDAMGIVVPVNLSVYDFAKKMIVGVGQEIMQGIQVGARFPKP